MSEASKLTVKCPDCESELVIDSLTGEILFHRKAREPLAGGQDFDSLFDTMDQQKSEAEATFEREVKAYEDRDRLLEEKFDIFDRQKLWKRKPEFWSRQIGGGIGLYNPI